MKKRDKLNSIDMKPLHYKLIKKYPGSGEIDSTSKLMSMCENYPEFWEPVYEENLKIGDWVTVTKNRSGWLCMTEEKTFLIVGDKAKYMKGTYWPVKSLSSDIGGGMCADFRKATTDEIILAIKPIILINNYRANFDDDYVRFGCARIHKKYFIEINKLNQSIINEHFNDKNSISNSIRFLTSVTIGKGVFYMNDVKRIAKYYEWFDSNKDLLDKSLHGSDVSE